jgi:hypothetical protein
VRNLNTTSMFNSNQRIFISSQLHVSAVYGHHQAGHRKENKYTVAISVEISMLYVSICIQYIHIELNRDWERSW